MELSIWSWDKKHILSDLPVTLNFDLLSILSKSNQVLEVWRFIFDKYLTFIGL